MELNYISIIGAIGLICSILIGFFCFEIFQVSLEDRPWPWKIQQWVLNFLGSAAGWVGLIILWPRLISLFQNTYNLTKGDFYLFLFTFIGITGYLPLAVITIIQGLSIIIAKIPGFLKLDK